MRLFVPLTRPEFDALREIARIERRRPQDQAAAMLAKVLAGDPVAAAPHNDPPAEHTPRRETRKPERALA